MNARRHKALTFEQMRSVVESARVKRDLALRAHRNGMIQWRDAYLEQACELYRIANNGPMVRWCRRLQETGVVPDLPGSHCSTSHLTGETSHDDHLRLPRSLGRR